MYISCFSFLTLYFILIFLLIEFPFSLELHFIAVIMQLFTNVGLMAVYYTLFYSMSVFTSCSGSPQGGVSATTYFPDHEVTILIYPTALREIKTPTEPRPNQNGSMTHFGLRPAS